MGRNINLSSEEKGYIAGFLDGDGSLLAQIVKSKDYRYGYTIRVSIVFYQKSKYHWLLLWLKSKLHYGYIRYRKDDISEYSIVIPKKIEEILIEIQDSLRIKKELSKLILDIIEKKSKVRSKEDFLEVCKLVDKAGKFTYGKRRKITTERVKEDFYNIKVN